MGASGSKKRKELGIKQSTNSISQNNIKDEEDDKESQMSYENEKPFEYDLIQEMDENQKQFVKESYDAIFSCNIVKNLHKNGWNYLLSNTFKKDS